VGGAWHERRAASGRPRCARACARDGRRRARRDRPGVQPLPRRLRALAPERARGPLDTGRPAVDGGARGCRARRRMQRRRCRSDARAFAGAGRIRPRLSSARPGDGAARSTRGDHGAGTRRLAGARARPRQPLGQGASGRHARPRCECQGVGRRPRRRRGRGRRRLRRARQSWRRYCHLGQRPRRRLADQGGRRPPRPPLGAGPDGLDPLRGPGDVQHRSTALASRRAHLASHHRPSHGSTRAHELANGERCRRDVHRRQHRRDRGARAWIARRRVAGAARPAGATARPGGQRHGGRRPADATALAA
jgi:hypothetical protein